MRGPDAGGDWTAEITLATGVYQYKFLANNEQWFADPLNAECVPDGYGKYNSVVRLGQLARMKKSEAKLGDGQISPIGLAHQAPLPLYI